MWVHVSTRGDAIAQPQSVFANVFCLDQGFFNGFLRRSDSGFQLLTQTSQRFGEGFAAFSQIGRKTCLERSDLKISYTITDILLEP